MNLTIAVAGTMVLIPDPRDVMHVMGSISKHKATLYSAVPTSYVRINTHPQVKEFDLSSVRVCLSGAAPLPLNVQEAFQAITGGKLVEAFGMTESSPATHVNPFSEGKRKVGSIGTPLPDTSCRIVDLGNPEKELPVGQPGEMVIKGPQVMLGYRNMPEETDKTIINGWLHTGDIALMDEDGYFFIVDRKKDMIISGGYNVYPRDIDEVLFTHPKVMEACAVGIPHPTRGEQIKAFVVPAPGQAPTEAELIAYCGEKLAKYKLPVAVEFKTELPKSNVGKILRKDLRVREEAR